MTQTDADLRQVHADQLITRLAGRPLVLVGMMGAGKTTVGQRIASRMDRQFFDSDEEIEKAARMSIPDFFEQRGEAEFRAGEARVIARLLKEKEIVLATGGGAFIHTKTRTLFREKAISIWLKADLDLLFERVSRRANRPLLQTENPRAMLKKLIAERYPTYAEADVTVFSRDAPPDVMAADAIDAVLAYLNRQD